ncbi:hypothetical protein F4225_06015 [Candidatus Poribacteria bacterium]|nr:hypothetical protein [Candidatus Poribacteria bacterium]
MKLLKNVFFACLLCFVIILIRGEQQARSHHTVGNGQMPHPDVHVNNSASSNVNYSSATVAPSVEGIELGIHDDRYECYGMVEVDHKDRLISGEDGAPKLFAILKATTKNHTVSVELKRGVSEIEIAGIGKVKQSTPSSGATFLGEIEPGYTVEWSTTKLKLDPDFKKLKDWTMHWWPRSGDMYFGTAYGSASGRNTSQTRECRAVCTIRSYGPITYGKAKCTGNEDASN